MALIKECYPTYFHRRDREGHRESFVSYSCFRGRLVVLISIDAPPHELTAVYVELLGRINLKKLKANGVTVAEMLRFYTYLTEYIWRVLEPDEGEVMLCLFCVYLPIRERRLCSAY